MAAGLVKTLGSSTTPTSIHQMLVCGCLESRCAVGSGAQRLAGSWRFPVGRLGRNYRAAGPRRLCRFSWRRA